MEVSDIALAPGDETDSYRENIGRMLDPQIDKFLKESEKSAEVRDLDALMDFYKFSACSDGLKDGTIKLTLSAFKLLRAFLAEKGYPTDIAQLGRREVQEFKLHLQKVPRYSDHPYTKAQDKRLSAHTVDAYLRALRAAGNRLTDDGLLLVSPFENVRLPRVPRKLIPAFSEDQIRAFFAAIDTSTHAGCRDYALFSVYADTGCRLSEVTNVKLEDLDLQRRSLKVHGKRGAERCVPVGAAAQKAIWKYLHLHRPEPAIPSGNWLFLTGDGRRLTNNRVETIMRRYGRKAGIQGVRCSPHTLRHTFCLLWLRFGGNLFALQGITGHASLEVLRGYVNLAQSDIEPAHRKSSPLDNLGVPYMPKRRSSPRN